MADEQPESEGAAESEGWRRFVPPWWTVLFPVVAALGAAGWRAATAEDGGGAAFWQGLVWPGLAVFAVVALITWLGWVLDID